MKIKLFLCMFLSLAFNIFAQTQSEGKKHYSLYEEDGHFRFTQKLEWRAVQNIGYYLIEVQEEIAPKKFNTILTKKLNQNSCELSLKSGSYRYRISLFNILGQMEQKSNWQNFTIHKAVQPEILDFEKTDFSFQKTSGKKSDSIFIFGKNLLKNSEVNLIFEDENTNVSVSGSVKMASENGENIKVHFDFTKLWKILLESQTNDEPLESLPLTIIIKNPGGLYAKKSGLTLSLKKEISKATNAPEEKISPPVPQELPQKEQANEVPEELPQEEKELPESSEPTEESEKEEIHESEEKQDSDFGLEFNLDVALGLSVPYQIIGKEYTEAMMYEEFFGKPYIFPSFTAQISFLPLRTKFGNFGLGIIADYSPVENSVERTIKSYTLTGELMSFYANLEWQKKINFLLLGLYAGGGVQVFRDFVYDFSTPYGSYSSFNLNSTGLAIDAGFSLKFLFFKGFFAGLSCNTCYNIDTHNGTVEPAILIGIKF
ncbi:hypothetical protein [Treponema zioleckii]|uniref:hypothetical protein n=1 Tax=Treponema zioleckii TaxID=331680 RepID=UPI00168AEBEB|nr:hypothetical protein [Treponema zioleckii]